MDMDNVGLSVRFNIGNGRGSGIVLKENQKTFLINTNDGNFIKRHKIKHNVKVYTKKVFWK